MILFRPPSAAQIETFLNKTGQGQFSYPEVGASAHLSSVKGYDNDFHRIRLGEGPDVFRIACEAIRAWQMFPGDWVRIEPADAPVEKGQVVAIVARAMGVYWLNNCRIVYRMDEKAPVRRFGFAYGTLGQHVEKGEELFMVEWLPDGTVWYLIYAFSKPRFWLARLAYPLARAFQRKFVRSSQRAMKREIEKRTGA